MKKRIIWSVVSLILIAIALFLASNIQTFSVVSKEEKRFCPPSPKRVCLVEAPNRKIIKTGRLSFECDNLEKTRQLIEAAIKQTGAFISGENLSTYDLESTQHLDIRVPADQFDALVETISAGAGRLDQRHIEIEDVTDDYIDTETRLGVKRELESRYRALLPKAESVEEILAIEEQIAMLREDLECAEGQIKRWDDRITLSSLEVKFYVQKDPIPVQFSRHIRTGFDNGWKNLIMATVGLINIWPFILIFLAIIFGFRFRRNNKGSSAESVSE